MKKLKITPAYEKALEEQTAGAVIASIFTVAMAVLAVAGKAVAAKVTETES